MPDEFMTPLEFAVLIRTPLGTIRKWRHEKSGPAGYRFGRRLLYRRSEVEKWIEQQRS